MNYPFRSAINIIMFQYKNIHNILATKISLFRAKMSSGQQCICHQCLAETHPLDHIFSPCSSVIAVWKTFQNWRTNNTKQQLALSNSVCFRQNRTWYSLTYMFLTAKFSTNCSYLQYADSFLVLLNEKLKIQKKNCI